MTEALVIQQYLEARDMLAPFKLEVSPAPNRENIQVSGTGAAGSQIYLLFDTTAEVLAFCRGLEVSYEIEEHPV